MEWILILKKEKMWSFLWFPELFQVFCSLLILLADSIARLFNMSGATQAVALDILKAFSRVLDADLLLKLRPYRILGYIFLISW